MIIDILTPDRPPTYVREASEQAKDYVEAFAAAGLELRARPWVEAGDRPAIALLAWGYHLALDRWLALLNEWPAATPLFNAPSLLRWNTRKTSHRLRGGRRSDRAHDIRRCRCWNDRVCL